MRSGTNKTFIFPQEKAIRVGNSSSGHAFDVLSCTKQNIVNEMAPRGDRDPVFGFRRSALTDPGKCLQPVARNTLIVDVYGTVSHYFVYGASCFE